MRTESPALKPLPHVTPRAQGERSRESKEILNVPGAALGCLSHSPCCSLRSPSTLKAEGDRRR